MDIDPSEWFIVHDEVWEAAKPWNEHGGRIRFLCIGCLEARLGWRTSSGAGPAPGRVRRRARPGRPGIGRCGCPEMDPLREAVLGFDPRLIARAEATMELQERMRDLVEGLDEHPELGAAYDRMVEALNEWLRVAALARDD